MYRFLCEKNALILEIKQYYQMFGMINDLYFYKITPQDQSLLSNALDKIRSMSISYDMDTPGISGDSLYTSKYIQQTPYDSVLKLIRKDILWIKDELKYFEDLFTIDEVFYNIPILTIPAEVYWDKYLSKDGSMGCSGVGDCDHCNKGMYPHRTGYLKSWITVYLKNKQDIDNGKVRIPKLRWFAATYANKFIIGDYHRSLCDKNKIITSCECDIACVLRAMYYANETDAIVSLDQIIPLFIKMRKHI